MTFIEALAEYHKGKKIRRKPWGVSIDPKSNEFDQLDFLMSRICWGDILADDWIAED